MDVIICGEVGIAARAPGRVKANESKVILVSSMPDYTASSPDYFNGKTTYDSNIEESTKKPLANREKGWYRQFCKSKRRC